MKIEIEWFIKQRPFMGALELARLTSRLFGERITRNDVVKIRKKRC